MKINFDSFPACLWSIKSKIEYLQRRIIVYSMLYYDFDFSCISDFDYDDISKQLYQMMKENEEEAEKSKYAYAFEGFEGSTGFDIPSKLNEEDKRHLKTICYFVMNANNKGACK